MTLREFLTGKTVTAAEVANGIVFNLFCNDEVYQVDVNTSNIVCGTVLVKFTNIIVNTNELIVNGITLNFDDTIINI